jgi:uncharacterized protein YndB with AHSA1/START domain
MNMPLEKITIHAVMPLAPEKVWEYYTEPKHITQWNFAHPSWHCPSASNDLRVGGKYLARMEARDGSAGFDFEAIYDEINIGSFFRYGMGGREVTVEVLAHKEGSEITVSFDPENENPIELQRQGWQAILDNFKSYAIRIANS